MTEIIHNSPMTELIQNSAMTEIIQNSAMTELIHNSAMAVLVYNSARAELIHELLQHFIDDECVAIGFVQPHQWFFTIQNASSELFHFELIVVWAVDLNPFRFATGFEDDFYRSLRIELHWNLDDA